MQTRVHLTAGFILSLKDHKLEVNSECRTNHRKISQHHSNLLKHVINLSREALYKHMDSPSVAHGFTENLVTLD